MAEIMGSVDEGDDDEDVLYRSPGMINFIFYNDKDNSRF
jgi:hypothetical protein